MSTLILFGEEPLDPLPFPIGDLTPDELERVLLNAQSCALVSTPFFPELATPAAAAA